MEFLKAGALTILFLGQFAGAQSDERYFAPLTTSYAAPKGMKFCDSAKEFKLAFKMLRKDPDLSLNDPQAIQTALKIAEGCDGASRRFGRVYLLLKKSGVAQAQAVNTAMTFAPQSDARVDGFMELFKKIFLANYLNLDFANAYRLSLDLSRDYQGDPKKLRKDFVSIVDFCLSNKGLALDFKNCSELTMNLTRHTDLYENGVFPEFRKVYDYLRFNKRTGLNIKEALLVLPRVMAKGEKAPANFMEMMRYLLEKGPFQGSQTDALKLSLWVADLSMRPDPEAARAAMAQ